MRDVSLGTRAELDGFKLNNFTAAFAGVGRDVTGLPAMQSLN